MRLRGLLFGVLALWSVGCTVKPKPIAYGSDGCHYCSMTIVDRQHAAQMVTKKGKVFKFDAVECMMNHQKEVDQETVALFLVNDYSEPGELIDAKQATYLISPGIPSPMGEFLTAFGDEAKAKSAHEGNGGDLYTWDELLNRFKP
ncbi:nitrous oxide reductase accessory protein NosL [Ulvibacterium sp.]|uniref:nitrous oxide reductase accessory protein NosL n=1 Tax=Ulvibacterium sp. TaxID=2665914 RepID=UPI00262148A3|nr:nitrous oxide reductase accessory protein NosL [Ulvibacterium sp.]